MIMNKINKTFYWYYFDSKWNIK